ncbi:MAG: U32 family peptidase C-terminal domain-containing protein [Elusimicrobia bacterium]|nr:U32 family peptidase C-terminal domain-containing protein [Elusimicrobiota bacterium]
MLKKPELLLPAGTLDKLKIAINYGADAVYAGLADMSLRAKSSFPAQDLAEGIEYARAREKKVYLTLNFFSKNEDEAKLKSFLNHIETLSPDGLIISDPGVFAYVKNALPRIPLHISTQANICSYLTVNFWKNMGASLCVLGREVSFSEALEIRQKCPDIRLEMFVQGAMCVSYSGRCLMSAFMASRPANKGACANSCRWKYKSKLIMEEELRPGEYLELFEDARGSYILNSKDLCLMPRLDKVLEANFDSLKIEGRTKSEYYTAQTARVYRKAIDDYFANPPAWKPDVYMQELAKLQNRGFTLGFFEGSPDADAFNYESTLSEGDYHTTGIVTGSDSETLTLKVKNFFATGDELEFLSPFQFESVKVKISAIYDAKTNESLSRASVGKTNYSVKISADKETLKLLPKYTLSRKKSK